MVNWQVESKPKSRAVWFILGGCLAVLLCLVCLSMATLAAYLYLQQEGSVSVAQREQEGTAVLELAPEAVTSPPALEPLRPGVEDSTPSPMFATPLPDLTRSPSVEFAPSATTISLNPPAELDQRPISSQTLINLDRLFETQYPHQDYFDTAVRLGGFRISARTIRGDTYQLKDIHSFQVDEERIDAKLMAVTDHVYFWVEEGLNLDEASLAKAAVRLEEDFYPRIVNLFGQEWQPGVDNDPHFSVLHLKGSTRINDIGYFTSVDEYPQSLYANSNEQELIYLNMAQLDLGSDLYYGTVVHELQHLIQWYVDPNETTWLNEGLAQLAELYVGLNSVDHDEYPRQPEIRLNSWTSDDDALDAHYAASFLLCVYLWEQLGDTAVQELSRHPANGMAAVRSVLQGHRPDLSLEQFIADWIVANFLDDPAAGPRYYYRNLVLARPTPELRVEDVPLDTVRQLDQFGAHFIDLDFRGPVTITFAADTVADLIEVPPRNGELMWFVPGVDDVDAQLTAAFDLSGLDRATLRFSTWYDLEEDYDFAYVSVSTDGGDSWQFLRPDHSTTGEFGPAFNGRSVSERDTEDGWLKESLSLDDYVGGSLLIRFEVLTDFETDSLGSGRGFAIDDISIPELGYHSDVETPIDVIGGAPVDGWIANGFVQVGWQLPQQWAVMLIEGGPQPTITRLPLNHLNQVQWSFEVGKGGATLAIIPLTPFVDNAPSYWLHLEQ